MEEDLDEHKVTVAQQTSVRQTRRGCMSYKNDAIRPIPR